MSRSVFRSWFMSPLIILALYIQQVDDPSILHHINESKNDRYAVIVWLYSRYQKLQASKVSQEKKIQFRSIEGEKSD